MCGGRDGENGCERGYLLFPVCCFVFQDEERKKKKKEKMAAKERGEDVSDDDDDGEKKKKKKKWVPNHLNNDCAHCFTATLGDGWI